MNASGNGLGLFDERASAVGNFPTSLRGYDRQAVDDYVRTLEANVVQSRRHAAGLEQQVTSLQDQVSNAAPSGDPSDLDYANLGGRANDMLRLAQDQARELVQNATIEAEKVKEQARREADDLRSSANRAGDAIKTDGTAEIDQLRARLQADAQAVLDKAKAEAEALIAAARRQADSLRREADHQAQATRQNAYLDTENLRRTVDREAAEIRQKIAAEREQAMTDLKAQHDEAQTQTAAMLAEATRFHAESAERLEADIAEAARTRADAVAEAEQTRLAAVEESDARVATAKKQAAAINERTQQEFAWRKQQLRRETELLHKRKQAVLSQLASLSALAEQTASGFPDLDDPSDLESGETGDRTVLRPGGHETDAGLAAEDTPEPAVDGDATVLVAPSDMPAGTAHLSDATKK